MCTQVGCQINAYIVVEILDEISSFKAKFLRVRVMNKKANVGSQA